MPKISGDNVIWVGGGEDASSRDLFAYDGSSTTQLTHTGLGVYEPQISGNKIVWTGSDGNDNEVFMAVLSDGPAPTSAANASFATDSDLDVLNIDLGTAWMNGTAAPVDFQIANLQGVSDTAKLQLVSVLGSGDTAALTTDKNSFVGLAAGEAINSSGLLNTSKPGSFNASYDLNFTDQLGVNQTMTLNLTGMVDAAASNASFASDADVDVLNIDFGVLSKSTDYSTVDFDITNLLDSDPTAELDLVEIRGSGDTNYLELGKPNPGGVMGFKVYHMTTFEDLEADNSRGSGGLFIPKKPGSYSATYELLFNDDLGTEQTLIINMAGEVAGLHANASFAMDSDLDVLNIDFGTLSPGDDFASIDLQLANFLAGPDTALLNFTQIIGTGDTDILSTNLLTNPIPAIGVSPKDFSASLNFDELGDFAATYELVLTDAYGIDQSLMLNLSGSVASVDHDDMPDLIYNTTTGEVSLDASEAIGGVITAYTLKSDGGFIEENYTPFLEDLLVRLTQLDTQLGEGPDLGGIAGIHSLGEIFPVGMTTMELYNFLTDYTVTGALGSGTSQFDLLLISDSMAVASIPVLTSQITVVPEPSSYALAAIGLFGLSLLVRRKRQVG